MSAVRDTDLIARLNTEWRWLCAQGGNAERVRAWLVDVGVLGAAEAPYDLDALLGELQERSRHEGRTFSDAWLDVLLRRATADADGEEAQLAARVLVQAMLPGAVRIPQRALRVGERFDEVAQVVIASLYQVVRSYPVARRPRQIARGLRLEMWHLVSRESSSAR